MDISAKERSSNFTADEIEKLKMLTDQFKDVLLCKKTDAVSYSAKEVAWNQIYRLFNANAVQHRSIKQLKYKFDNLKKTARKDASKERQERRRSGGGRPDIPSTFGNGDWMRSIIIMSTDGLEAKYDDDFIESKPKEPIATVEECSNTLIIDETSQTMSASTSQIDNVVEETQELQFTNINGEKIDISENADMLPVFDSGGPASLLRCPVSTPLKRPRESSTVTPQALRKSFRDLNKKKLCLADKKNNVMDEANAREEQEFQQKIKIHEQVFHQNKETHEQALRHNEEKYAAEMTILKLKADLLKLEIEKLNK